MVHSCSEAETGEPGVDLGRLNMESDTVEKIREKFRTFEPEDQKKVLEFVERLSAETAQSDASTKEGVDDGSKGP